MAKKNDPLATILVVDDDAGIREVFAEVLSDEGYKVVVAAEADSATKIVKKQHIDLALVDIWLKPGIDGIELIKRWRENNLLTFPLGVISAHAEVPTTVLAMREGALDVLTKPIGAKTLLEFVSKTLTKVPHTFTDQLHEQLKLGSTPSLVKIKGQLLKRTKDNNPLLVIAPPNGGGEFFARLIHPVGRPWIAPVANSFLAKEPTAPLKHCGIGSIYLRDITNLDELKQRGLNQLLHTAIGQNVRVNVESTKPLKQLITDGDIAKETAQMLDFEPIEIPPMLELSHGINAIIAAAVRMYAPDYERATDCVSEDAIAMLAAESGRWNTAGLGSLLAIIRVLLETTTTPTITATAVEHLIFSPEGASANVGSELFTVPLRDARARFEKLYFLKLMESVNNNFVEAANISGLERSYLYRKVRLLIEEEGIELAEPPDK